MSEIFNARYSILFLISQQQYFLKRNQTVTFIYFDTFIKLQLTRGPLPLEMYISSRIYILHTCIQLINKMILGSCNIGLEGDHFKAAAFFIFQSTETFLLASSIINEN